MTTHTDPVQPPEQDPTDLLGAVNSLSRNVVTLTQKLDVASRIAKQNRLLTGALALIVVVITVFGGWQWHRVSEAVQLNQANAVQQCENANDSRAANHVLWDFVLRLSAADEVPTEEEAANLKALRKWIGQLYAPHDCDNLSEVYPIPPPPSFEALR